MPAGKSDSSNLHLALVGTLIVADAVCVRLWFIMEEIRMALTDPMAMAFIITDDKVVSDNKASEAMLASAKGGFHDAERAVLLFSVCLGLITVAMLMRIIRGTTRPGEGDSVSGVRKRV
jgi:hypothetical protein